MPPPGAAESQPHKLANNLAEAKSVTDEGKQLGDATNDGKIKDGKLPSPPDRVADLAPSPSPAPTAEVAAPTTESAALHFGQLDMSWCQGADKVDLEVLKLEYGLCKHVFMGILGCPHGAQCLLRHHYLSPFEQRIIKNAGRNRVVRDQFSAL